MPRTAYTGEYTVACPPRLVTGRRRRQVDPDTYRVAHREAMRRYRAKLGEHGLTGVFTLVVVAGRIIG